MLTVFPCYATEDLDTVRDLAEFLQLGAGVQIFLEDGEIGLGESIVTKAADGLEAAVILLILSPDSTPARWVRAEWEPVMLLEPKSAGVKVSTVLARNCEFPALLRREAFVDLTQDRLGGFRQIKRWLLGLYPARPVMEFEPARQKLVDANATVMEDLRQALADKPGRVLLSGAGKTTLAIEFARQSKRDFEGLIWLSCAGQSMASLAGEMASQLGMALEGEVEDNLRELTRFCAQRRLLVILHDPPEEAEKLIPGGLSSTLILKPEADASAPEDESTLLNAAHACGNVPFRLPLVAEIADMDVGSAVTLLEKLVEHCKVTQLDVRSYRYLVTGAPPNQTLAAAHARAVRKLFANWAMAESECEAELPQLRRALDWALSQQDAENWSLACDLAWRGVALMKRERRQAEVFETLEVLSHDAERREDRRTIEDCSRELVWILESWGRTGEAHTLFQKHRAQYEDQMQFDFG